MGLLYLCTLGVFGIGWLSDLYWQRRYLFGVGAGGSAGGAGGSGRGVLKAGKELIENSTFGETWRRNKHKYGQNRHLRLDEEADAGRAKSGQGRGRRSRHEKLRGGRVHGESCGEDEDEGSFDDQDVQLQIYGDGAHTLQTVAGAGEVGAAKEAAGGSEDSAGGDSMDALAMAPTATVDGWVSREGAPVNDDLVLHQPRNP